MVSGFRWNIKMPRIIVPAKFAVNFGGIGVFPEFQLEFATWTNSLTYLDEKITISGEYSMD